MNTVATIVVAVMCLAAGLAGGAWLATHRRRVARQRPRPAGRILLPFTGQAISRRALDAALRLAKAENATIMPAFLARVPRNLPMEAPLPAACREGMPLLDAIEQGATAQGIDVDARIAGGRTYRDALRHLVEQERFDRIIISATDSPRRGLTGGDLEWLLERVPAEVMILRSARTTPALSLRTGGRGSPERARATEGFRRCDSDPRAPAERVFTKPVSRRSMSARAPHSIGPMMWWWNSNGSTPCSSQPELAGTASRRSRIG